MIFSYNIKSFLRHNLFMGFQRFRVISYRPSQHLWTLNGSIYFFNIFQTSLFRLNFTFVFFFSGKLFIDLLNDVFDGKLYFCLIKTFLVSLNFNIPYLLVSDCFSHFLLWLCIDSVFKFGMQLILRICLCPYALNS